MIRALIRPMIGAALLLAATPAAAQIPAYPPGNAVAGNSGNVANATATATLTASAGRTNYLNGIVVTAGGATVAAVVTCTVTGLQGGTMTFIYGAPLGVGLLATPLMLDFSQPLPASGPNVAIVISCPALGVGNTNMAITARGHME